jgi:hypothetical protein
MAVLAFMLLAAAVAGAWRLFLGLVVICAFAGSSHTTRRAMDAKRLSARQARLIAWLLWGCAMAALVAVRYL